jgi:hypothetical protein
MLIPPLPCSWIQPCPPQDALATVSTWSLAQIRAGDELADYVISEPAPTSGFNWCSHTFSHQVSLTLEPATGGGGMHGSPGWASLK